MLNTFHGTVASDPMRIPAPARMAPSDEQAFADELSRAAGPRERPEEPTPEAPADIDEELAEVQSEHVDGESPVTPAPREEETPRAEAALHETERTDIAAAAADVTETQRRGETGRRSVAGKGTDSLRTSSTRRSESEPMLDELAGVSARAAQVRGHAMPTMPSSAPATSKGTGDPLLRGVEGPSARLHRGATHSVRPGYRTSGRATAEMIERSRDSVFKQILLKIAGDGGEMRMRLEPPSFGELDLRMKVEGGNKVSLSIATEHPELASVLQHHLAGLGSMMADAGLELTHADVQTRDEREGGGSTADPDAGADGEESTEIMRPRAGGYIRADGLDFWA